MKYVDLVMDNRTDSTDGLYTYASQDDDIRVGTKVRVYFGRGKTLRDGYVFDVKDEPPKGVKNIKYVTETDKDVSLTEEIIDTCLWMKRRYLCRYIDAVKQFLPVGAPLKSGLRRPSPASGEGESAVVEALTPGQRKAIDTLSQDRGFGMYLLHGVTGSGKTEVYMRMLSRCIEEGKAAIIMVPEIALAGQIIDRFAGRFGAENIAALHSGLSAGERYDEWMRIRTGDVKIVIGARSAVFAPLDNIGLIVLDEEHEASYKSETAPRYETVEIAVRRAMKMDAKVILGSATPSVVSYRRSEDGIYKRIEMPKRYNEVELPDVEIVDMRKELREGNGSIFSRRLRQATDETLASGKQAIFFLNRRGYATFISCRECGYVMKCPTCGISMTYHKEEDRCVCHYCGHTEPFPGRCPECGSKHIGRYGTGTEKVEEAIQEAFPGRRTARLDMDTMRRKGSTEKILKDFALGKTDILTGTQVVAKGIDVRNVGFVGIISADASLNIPDYRSGERTFQLITQAAGRAGRGSEKGRVIIQTFSPDNYAIRAASRQDYREFYKNEIAFREMGGYPPFGDMIEIIIGSRDEGVAKSVAGEWELAIKNHLGQEAKNVLPHRPIISKRPKEESKECILIKCPPGRRREYLALIAMLKEKSDRGRYRMVVDINPYNLWRN